MPDDVLLFLGWRLRLTQATTIYFQSELRVKYPSSSKRPWNNKANAHKELTLDMLHFWNERNKVNQIYWRNQQFKTKSTPRREGVTVTNFKNGLKDLCGIDVEHGYFDYDELDRVHESITGKNAYKTKCKASVSDIAGSSDMDVRFNLFESKKLLEGIDDFTADL